MFNIGGGELIVIALIALIVLGPERLPGAARQIGKTLGDLRRLSSGFQEELRGALEAEPTDTPTSPRRDVLGGGASAGADGSVSSAVRSASGEDRDAGASAPQAPDEPAVKKTPRRREPLVAGPAATNGRKPSTATPATAKPAGKRAAAKKRSAAPSRRRSS